MNKTKIEWCDATWNPVTGCLHKCEYCYARKIANRFGTIDKMIESAAEEGIGLDSAYFGNPEYFSVLNEPFRDENNRIEPYPTNFYPTFHRYRLDEPQRKTKPRTIFVCSMADLFGDWVPDEWIEQVFEACVKAQQHTYLFLTKNPERYTELLEKGKLPIRENFWYGITAGNEDMCYRASFALNDAIHAENAPNFFISAEPLLEDVTNTNGWVEMCFDDGVKWVIVGAESGTRKCKVVPKKAWIDNIIDDCEYNGISLFMKDSLIPIVGDDNMRREFPWSKE